MIQAPYYVTTPIYYANAGPHLGSAYTTLLCDILRRYQRLLGRDTYFLTGTDEYGQNILQVARQGGLEVRDMVDANSALFRALWPRLDIHPDDFIRTTEERHHAVVRLLLQRVYDSGDIYSAEYGGQYCVKCERFYLEKETEALPGHCPIHESPLEEIRERNYFFRLSKYQDWLREKIESEPAFLGPAQFRSEVLALLRDPLEDLCISRPAARLPWGIPLPFDDQFVTYVWFDALTNYVSALGYPDGDKFARFWPGATHLIAKDILRQHAVYWPCILQAAGIECFQRLRVHGYWTVGGKKMGKSMGNVVDPLAETAKWGLDVFRYFLAREMSFGSDGDYSPQALVGRNNAELANDLGNLLSRVTAMIAKYHAGVMPPFAAPEPADRVLLAELDKLPAELPAFLDRAAVHAFLERVNQAVVATNKYLTDQAPWTRAKEGRLERVGTILAVASQALTTVADLLSPVMPGKMAALLACFHREPPTVLRNLPVEPGTPVVPAPPLFPQLEWEAAEVPEAPVAVEAAPVAAAPVSTPVEPIKPEIAFEDFAKVDLRIATILEAEPVPKTDKLMRLTIDIGVEQRQIVAGIAAHCAAADLVGRQIVIVANLAPRKLKGLLSQGMLLAGKTASDLFLLAPAGPLPPGAGVS